MEVISQIPWSVLSCLSASSTVVFMSEIDAVDALSDVLLSDDSLRPVQMVWSAEHMINTIDNSVIPWSIVPTVPDCFFQAYTGSTIHLVWSSDCCVNHQESHIDQRLQWSAVSVDGSGLAGLVNASFSQQFCLGYEVSYVRRFRCRY